jgi:transcriptional regulatory protein RtcR
MTIGLQKTKYIGVTRILEVKHCRSRQLERKIVVAARVEETSTLPLRYDSVRLDPAGFKLVSASLSAEKASQQLAGEFVEVNCATIRGESAMSALFGHVKGAFTGATSDRAGLLRKADKGLIFLDEIGELGLDEQAMLLKAIEEKRFFPFGGDKEVTSDFQLIAGTNRDLRDDIKAGRFREDLFARINLWTFFLPSLTERNEDIEPNLDYELTRFAQENAVTVRFNKEAKEKYLTFATSPVARWAGNFRELSASITRMATLADGGRISVTVVDEEIVRLKMLWHTEPQSSLSEVLEVARSAEIDLFDQLQLTQVIAVCRASRNLAEAGRKLFSVSMAKRSSANDTDRLRKYLARFGLAWKDISQEA